MSFEKRLRTLPIKDLRNMVAWRGEFWLDGEVAQQFWTIDGKG